MLQIKEQDKNVQEQQNEEEICNLPEKQFRVMITKMTQKSQKKNGGIDQEDTRKSPPQGTKRCKNKQIAMSTTVTERKNTLEGQ